MSPIRDTGAPRRPRLDTLHRKIVGVSVILLALAMPAWADTFHGRVIGVSDGDTIAVLREGRRAVVRVSGIDAPEKAQAFGTRAKQFTATLAFGKTVAVRVRGSDRYGRTIGDVALPDGSDLAQEVVRAGYAWWFRRYSTDPRLAGLEAEARAAQVGLWADAAPTSPWEWRQQQAALRHDRAKAVVAPVP